MNIVFHYTEALFTAIGIIVVIIFVVEFGPEIKKGQLQKWKKKKNLDNDNRGNADYFKSK